MRGNGRVSKDDQHRRRAIERVRIRVAEDSSVHALKLRNRILVLHDDDLYRLSAHAGGRPGARARDGAWWIRKTSHFRPGAQVPARVTALSSSGKICLSS